MKIGLIDVDGLGYKRKRGGSLYPNIALCKLSRYHKSIGDDVEWALIGEHYDIIYMSKIFTFTEDYDIGIMNADKIVKGGTGYDPTTALPEDVDDLQPDYSIYPSIPGNYAYGFLTRGCPNKCPWCVVPVKEGRVRPYMDVDEIAIEGRDHLVLMDNNILASGDYGKSQLRKIAERGYRVDFNQAMDARLMTDEWADLLVKVKWIGNTIRFGCDTTAQIDHCEEAMSMLEDRGFKGNFFLYTMIGGKNDINECYERIKHWAFRLAQHREGNSGGHNCYPYAQPYIDPFHPSDAPPQWQKDMARWCNMKATLLSVDFKDYEPRKNFKCKEYFKS